MDLKHKKRKHLKPDQRLRIWSHGLKEAALAVVGQDMSQALRGLPKRAPTDEDVQAWLGAPAAQDGYAALSRQVREHCDDNRSESVGNGDCFALFALTTAVRASRAMEIGTHLGFSTLHIAAALASNGVPAKLTTVDITDVNDERIARYRAFGASMSAGQRLRALGLEDRVDFIVSASGAFLKQTRDTYDFIFIDGDHSEAGAYFDIWHSLQRLNENGIIVLHDYNDPHDPTPGGKTGQYGVHWALHRLRSRIPDIGVVRLPSVTPLGAAAPVPTTLAVVTRRALQR